MAKKLPPRNKTLAIPTGKSRVASIANNPPAVWVHFFDSRKQYVYSYVTVFQNGTTLNDLGLDPGLARKVRLLLIAGREVTLTGGGITTDVLATKFLDVEVDSSGRFTQTLKFKGRSVRMDVVVSTMLNTYCSESDCPGNQGRR